ncbi:MobV family relaxase [Vibrio vulnificus]|uniref:MobV family relaxase n=1 Tax=Vibrio vulnificus TaxID=672 RepID=UPI001FAF8E18|nr:MobV family relaxase [Vibrio vulnificus]MCJ0814283.1 plasmid recombination protein [Vibrio vulnificus]
MKTVLRFKKIKDFNNLNLSNAHVYRYLDTPNANPKILNKKLLGSGNVVRDVKRKINENNIKPRKNAVLCIEAILSLSPCYFKNNKNVKDFAITARKWLINEFGENLISAVLHLDEKTPHIHAHIIPITDDKRLSARDLFNKITLPDLQKSYLDKMKVIEPNLTYNKGAKIEHTDLKEFYSMVNNELDNNNELKDKIIKLENKIEEKDDVQFSMRNKIIKLERKTKSQINEINELEKLVDELNETINNLSVNKKIEEEEEEYEYQHLFPELNPKNFPDEPEIKKSKKRNRLRR